MDDIRPPRVHLDYQQAAERLLVALCTFAQHRPSHPIPAVRLVRCCFDQEIRRHWQHESCRRRVRETVIEARKLLAQQATAATPAVAGATLVANGEGYWITGDRQIIAWYASKRRRHGLSDLAAASQAKKQLGAQPSLFGTPS